MYIDIHVYMNTESNTNNTNSNNSFKMYVPAGPTLGRPYSIAE